MSGVQLHAVEAGLPGDRGGVAKSLDQIENFWIGEGDRRSERDAGKGQRHGGGRLGRRVDPPACLATGVGQLHPDMRAFALGGGRPGFQRRQLVSVLRTLNGHIAGMLQVASVDLYIAGEQQARAVFGPGAIERLVRLRRAVARIRQQFRHGRLHQAVGQGRPAGQGQRRVEDGGVRHRRGLGEFLGFKQHRSRTPGHEGCPCGSATSR